MEDWSKILYFYGELNSINLAQVIYNDIMNYRAIADEIIKPVYFLAYKA